MTRGEAVILVSLLAGLNLVLYLNTGLGLSLAAIGACFITLAIILTA